MLIEVCRLQVADFGLRAADCGQQVAGCGLQNAGCRLQMKDYSIEDYRYSGSIFHDLQRSFMIYSHSIVMKSIEPTTIMTRIARVPGFFTGIGMTKRTETTSIVTK